MVNQLLAPIESHPQKYPPCREEAGVSRPSATCIHQRTQRRPSHPFTSSIFLTVQTTATWDPKVHIQSISRCQDPTTGSSSWISTISIPRSNGSEAWPTCACVATKWGTQTSCVSRREGVGCRWVGVIEEDREKPFWYAVIQV